MNQTITTYFFRVGNCTMSSKAHDKETALLYMQRMWRTSKIEYVGEEFSHIVDAKPLKSVAKPTAVGNSFKQSVKRTVPPIKKPVIGVSLEDRLEQALVENFGG